ncbi:hypothetical protein V2053_001001 [Vibrio cholerae]|nr:hypothetical protein [Vibrio cholerae]
MAKLTLTFKQEENPQGELTVVVRWGIENCEDETMGLLAEEVKNKIYQLLKSEIDKSNGVQNAIH